jgi:hypothetical protein
MPHGASDVRTLDRSTCLALLSSVGLGRVGLSVDALPVILPVGFRVDGDRIVFALRPGDRAAGALDDVVVAFEADDVDPVTGSGWTVLVQGPARVVTARTGYSGADWVLLGRHDTPKAPELVSVSTDVITGWLTGTVVHGGPLPVAPSPA